MKWNATVAKTTETSFLADEAKLALDLLRPFVSMGYVVKAANGKPGLWVYEPTFREALQHLENALK